MPNALPRIHVKKIINDEEIYGALNIDATKYIGSIINKRGQTKLLFKTTKHGTVYCDPWMALRIKERLSANKIYCSAIDNALREINLNAYAMGHPMDLIKNQQDRNNQINYDYE